MGNWCFWLKVVEIRKTWEINGKQLGIQWVQIEQPLFFFFPKDVRFTDTDHLTVYSLRCIKQELSMGISKTVSHCLLFDKQIWQDHRLLGSWFLTIQYVFFWVTYHILHIHSRCILSARLLILHRLNLPLRWLSDCSGWARKVLWKRCGASAQSSWDHTISKIVILMGKMLVHHWIVGYPIFREKTLLTQLWRGFTVTCWDGCSMHLRWTRKSPVLGFISSLTKSHRHVQVQKLDDFWLERFHLMKYRGNPAIIHPSNQPLGDHCRAQSIGLGA